MPIATSKRLFTILAVLAVALGACSTGGSSRDSEGISSTSPPTGSTVTPVAPAPADTSAQASTVAPGKVTVEACDLLTPEEVARAIGNPTQDPKFDDSVADFFTCSYEGTDGSMLLDVTVYPDVATAENMFAAGIDIGGNERIEGPGDEAMSTQPIGDIIVRVGRMEISIDLFTNDKSRQEELTIVKALAAAAVTQLG